MSVVGKNYCFYLPDLLDSSHVWVHRVTWNLFQPFSILPGNSSPWFQNHLVNTLDKRVTSCATSANNHTHEHTVNPLMKAFLFSPTTVFIAYYELHCTVCVKFFQTCYELSIWMPKYKKVTSQGQAVGATEINKINDVFSAATRPCCTHSVPGWFPPLAIQSSLAYVFKTQTSSDLNYNLCSIATTCMFVSVRNRVNGNITTVTELAENHQQLTKKPYNQSTSRTWLQHAGREKLT